MTGGEPAVDAEVTETLGYATPARVGGTAGVGFALIFGGLGLIFLGGCFLIGVLITSNLSGFNGVPTPITARHVLLLVVLYLAAFACFGGGAWLIVLAVRHMLGKGR